MKVTREQAAQNRERIVETASQLFRERGFDGIGVAGLMQEVGLTHGGFYGHFASKEALIAEASTCTLKHSLTEWNEFVDRSSDDPLTAIVDRYLSRNHRDNPGEGCLLAALGPDLSRQGADVRHAASGAIRSALDFLTKLVPGKSKAAKRQKAISAYATLVGTMVMARIVDDPILSQEILDAGLTEVKR
ncbi:TetR/AcrR family transcriptional regulator [Porticoccus sp.]|uniref:TetR/AcrR family transcriptional regulator n=1 Tax=Porticoccus sp. TaxID=2024853 RepID=UPI003F69755B